MLPLTKKDKNSRKYTSTSFPFPNEQISQQTWPIKYKPKLSQDLALHNSKIKVIQQWLNKSIEDKSEPVGFDGISENARQSVIILSLCLTELAKYRSSSRFDSLR